MDLLDVEGTLAWPPFSNFLEVHDANTGHFMLRMKWPTNGAIRRVSLVAGSLRTRRIGNTPTYVRSFPTHFLRLSLLSFLGDKYCTPSVVV